MEGETHIAMSSAAAETVEGVMTYEEFLTIFESHNRAYLYDVRELVGGTAQRLLASGQLTPDALFAASQKHPWALGNLGGKAGAATQADTQRVGKLETELAAARAEVAATKRALQDALRELDGEYALAEARATAAVHKAEGEKLAADTMLGRTAAAPLRVPALPLPAAGLPAPPPPHAPTWHPPTDGAATAPTARGQGSGGESARNQSEMASFLEEDDDDAEAESGPDRGSVHGIFKAAPAWKSSSSSSSSDGSTARAPRAAAVQPAAQSAAQLAIQPGERAARRASGAHYCAYAPKPNYLPNYLPEADLPHGDARAFLDSDDEAERPSIGGFA